MQYGINWKDTNAHKIKPHIEILVYIELIDLPESDYYFQMISEIQAIFNPLLEKYDFFFFAKYRGFQ